MDYTFLGDQTQVEFEGVWADVTINIAHDDTIVGYTSADFTLFIAIGKPPDKGLDGVLSIAVLPMQEPFNSLSLITNIEKKYDWQTIYISMNFPKHENFYTGQVVFETENELVDDMTFGGQIFLNAESFDEDIFKKKVVKPFMELKMSQISFKTVLLQ